MAVRMKLEVPYSTFVERMVFLLVEALPQALINTALLVCGGAILGIAFVKVSLPPDFHRKQASPLARIVCGIVDFTDCR